MPWLGLTLTCSQHLGQIPDTNTPSLTMMSINATIPEAIPTGDAIIQVCPLAVSSLPVSRAQVMYFPNNPSVDHDFYQCADVHLINHNRN
jgi:hypothetical protein